MDMLGSAMKRRRIIMTILLLGLLWTVLLQVIPGFSFLNLTEDAKNAVSTVIKLITFPFSWLMPRKVSHGPWISHLEQNEGEEQYDRIEYYCEAPKFPASVLQNEKILAMQMLIRHGDRGTLFNVTELPHKYCPYDESYSLPDVVHSYYEMISLLKISEESISHFGFAPERSSCASGHLTSKGVLQHIQLGSAVRRRLGGLAEKWITPETTVFSTLFPRTYQSALAFMHGLNPTTNPKIPHSVFFAPPDEIQFCSLASTFECIRDSKLFGEYFRLTTEFFNKDRESTALITTIRNLLTGHLDKPLAVWPVYVFDVILHFACHGGHMPCFDGTCLSYKELVGVFEVLEQLAEKVSREPTLRKYAVVDSYGILNKIMGNLQKVAEGADDASRFTLFSAHDSTIAPVLHALGLPFQIAIPYASYLAFEIYSLTEGSTQEDKYIRIIYNGEDMTRKSLFGPHCGKQKHRCRFTTFQTYVEDQLKDEFWSICNKELG
ncbi:2-phosphoxylose phosphatase 1-like isoform X2 [Paramacrobiotus metropolitanus]|nr:2-phosphoxylose phosphatase 1-like isoform X2 [Paramacrobiotus metropolitanus]XP_055340083.1 2-phosphoxylose phosphatase 1-like isoform X2 [Paramacrobiotus metropolitanus]